MNRNVKLIIIILALFVLSATVSGCSHCCKDKAKPSMDMSESISVVATVEAIDYETRHVTLKGPQGNSTTLYVDEEAYNFKEVEVGDLVDIQYHASIAVNLEKGSGKNPLAVVGSTTTRAPEGQKPEGAAYNVIDVRAVVEDIDYEDRTVDLRGPRGNVITVDVDNNVENFKNIKKGDEVTAT
jgi:hypothetical protein